MRSNGGEGFSDDKGYLILWRVEELAQLNEQYEVEIDAPGFIVFGTNGGGEAYAFDRAMCVCSLPFIGMAPDTARYHASSFADFAAPFLSLRSRSEEGN